MLCPLGLIIISNVAAIWGLSWKAFEATWVKLGCLGLCRGNIGTHCEVLGAIGFHLGSQCWGFRLWGLEIRAWSSQHMLHWNARIALDLRLWSENVDMKSRHAITHWNHIPIWNAEIAFARRLCSEHAITANNDLNTLNPKPYRMLDFGN